MKPKKCLILANGRAPRKNDLKYFVSRGFADIICADGGCNSAFKMGITPHCIIGDLDSAEPEILEYYKGIGVPLIKYNRQNDTDVEKCIKYLISKKYTDVMLCAITGDRLDHSFCNIGVVLKFADKVNIYLHHESSIMYSVKGKVDFDSHPSELISLYGIDASTTFTSKGLKYSLTNTSLKFGVRESTSNVSKGSKVTLDVRKGRGLIVRELKMIKKHGLLFND